MKNKLLISTLLASSAVSSNVFAVEPTIAYDTNNNFVINGQKFATFSEADKFITTKVKNGTFTEKEVEAGMGKVTTDSYVNLFNQALHTEQGAKNLVAMFNSEAPIGEQVTVAEFKQLADAIKVIETFSDTSFAEEFRRAMAEGNDIDDLFADLYEIAPEIIEEANYITVQYNMIQPTLEEAIKADPVLAKYAKALAANNGQLTDELSALANSKELQDRLDNIIDAAAEKYFAQNPEKFEQNQIEALKTRIARLEKENAKNNTKDKKSSKFSKTMTSIEDDIEQVLGKPKEAKKVSDLKTTAKPDNYTTHGMMASSTASAAVVDNRVSEVAAVSGFSSGDIFTKFGAWAKGTISRGQQKSYALEPGYKFDQTGVTIGFDTGDDYVIGIAYSLFNNNVKSKKANDTKEKITSHIGTVYGAANLGSFYVSGHAQAGRSDIKKNRYSGDLDNHVAVGKTKGTIFGGKVEVGYNYAIPEANTMLTPSLAVVHNDVKVKGYKEKGKGLNRKIGKRNSSRTDGTAGLTAKYRADLGGGMILIPEVHAFVSHALNAKNSDTKIYLFDGIAPTVTPGQKLTKTHYKVGTALNLVAQDTIEASVGYDLGIAKKFQSHTGSVKIRVNF